jgi:hypothetical protein
MEVEYEGGKEVTFGRLQMRVLRPRLGFTVFDSQINTDVMEK